MSIIAYVQSPSGLHLMLHFEGLLSCSSPSGFGSNLSVVCDYTSYSIVIMFDSVPDI